MSITARIKSWLGWGTASPAAPPPVSSGSGALPWRQPPVLSTARLLKLYEENDDLRRVVDLISARAGSAKWKITRAKKEVSDSDQLARLWARPNRDMTGASFLTLLQTYLDLTDEAFIHIVRDELSRSMELYPIPPSWVTVKGEVTAQGVPYREFEVCYPNGQRATLGEDVMLWLKRPSASDPYGRGRGRGYAAADPAEISEYSSKYLKSFFYNDATPSMLVYVPGMRQEDAQRFKAGWNNRNQGAGKSFGLELLGGGPGDTRMTVHQMQPALKDLTISEIGKDAGDAIRQLYGVPPELVGQLENSNRATISEALAILGVLVLQPRLTWLERELNARLLPLLGLTGYTLTVEVPIPANTTLRSELMRALPGHFSRNEVRAAADLPPVKGGDSVALNNNSYTELDLADIEEVRAVQPPPLPAGATVRLKVAA